MKQITEISAVPGIAEARLAQIGQRANWFSVLV